MPENEQFAAYGLWPLVFIHSAIFIFFAASFFNPQTTRDWRSLGAFSAFLIALFAEMYGFPLTIYLLSGWLVSLFPEVDLFSHEAGHLWWTVLGREGNPHFGVPHLVSQILIGGGFILLAASWRVLFKAQCNRSLATTGPYAHVRHPQYLAFILIMIGFLLQWPTLPTAVMFPVLTYMYYRLAMKEEREAEKEFGEAYSHYASNVPAFVPRLPKKVGGYHH